MLHKRSKSPAFQCRSFPLHTLVNLYSHSMATSITAQAAPSSARSAAPSAPVRFERSSSSSWHPMVARVTLPNRWLSCRMGECLSTARVFPAYQRTCLAGVVGLCWATLGGLNSGIAAECINFAPQAANWSERACGAQCPGSCIPAMCAMIF